MGTKICTQLKLYNRFAMNNHRAMITKILGGEKHMLLFVYTVLAFVLLMTVLSRVNTTQHSHLSI